MMYELQNLVQPGIMIMEAFHFLVKECSFDLLSSTSGS